MTTPTTEKPRITDWNAWLGEVPPERPVSHLYCNDCWPDYALAMAHAPALCGDNDPSNSEPAQPDDVPCAACEALREAPCSPRCIIGRLP